ncbi:hypothetical protein KDX16_31000 [Burkholderia vietnamiensis]|uniref:hypothetical protein n=1 Tax=Burkholderia vietnamiensis TaxID=60552 RepID=UPI00075B3B12|nr:hypothetical protein [Burkholderia vietnamiensis]KVR89515.1 hypothetical protein WK28_24200 [Burkholderia vietnamiensis]MBR7920229.1 hypothetical protein [Burkholderia vietnamiensis]MBR8205317.1 hypothetical protein [Burkholderia vietnamiensis]HDR9133239.1 hypothetical protein [Burkholderia vietnamiensis]
MSVKITDVQPCTDWFFVAPANEPGGKPIVYRLAAWGMAADGEEGPAIVGLVPVMSTGKERVMPHAPRLVPVPAIGGRYKHLKDLAPAEVSALE